MGFVRLSCWSLESGRPGNVKRWAAIISHGVGSDPVKFPTITRPCSYSYF